MPFGEYRLEQSKRSVNGYPKRVKTGVFIYLFHGMPSSALVTRAHLKVALQGDIESNSFLSRKKGKKVSKGRKEIEGSMMFCR